MEPKRRKCPDCGQLKDADPDGWMMVKTNGNWRLVCKECGEKARKSGVLVVNY